MAIRLRLSNTSGNTTLAQHDLVSDAEVAAASSDLIAVWGGGTAQQASVQVMKFMVQAFRTETISRLRNRDVADEQAVFNTAKATAEALYSARYEPVP